MSASLPPPSTITHRDAFNKLARTQTSLAIFCVKKCKYCGKSFQDETMCKLITLFKDAFHLLPGLHVWFASEFTLALLLGKCKRCGKEFTEVTPCKRIAMTHRQLAVCDQTFP